MKRNMSSIDCLNIKNCLINFGSSSHTASSVVPIMITALATVNAETIAEY